jgi:hypothetical protein
MSAQAVYPHDLQDIAQAVDLFVEQVFRREDGSLFTPGKPVWTVGNLNEVKQRFVDQLDDSSGTFMQKLAKQLDGASDAALQLMAEALYAYFMVPDQMYGKKKLENIKPVLGWMKQPVEILPALVKAADNGLGNSGIFFLTNKPSQLWFIINTAIAWRQRPPAEREVLLTDPWAFKKFLMSVPENRGASMRMALLHMVHPGTFEIIISANHKQLICAAFPNIAPGETDEDRKLLEIKKSLPSEPKTIHTFYREDVKEVWDPIKPPPPPPVISPSPVSPAPKPTPPTVESVAKSLYLDPAWLTEVRDVLVERGQIVLVGPPGTGKTRVARELASLLAPAERVHFVQFHPAYSYEDFIEGLRPVVGGGPAHFEVRLGPLRCVAQAASAHPGELFILVIDEINRANLARVLGELVFLLEYRGESATLPYSGDRLSLPKNLLIIGTMNTADRSIALIDAAIRRRFAFFRLAPDCPPIDRVLADWLEANAPEMVWIDEVVNKANEIIGSADHAIGPTFFMRPGLDEASIERIWKWQVLPYLDEFLHDAIETRQKLELGRLRRESEFGQQ